MNENEAFELGKDYAKNGANTTNCNFSIFTTPKLKEEKASNVYKKLRCKFCGSEDFTLMCLDDTREHHYYYHYGDYDKGCRQRINVFEICDYAETIECIGDYEYNHHMRYWEKQCEKKGVSKKDIEICWYEMKSIIQLSYANGYNAHRNKVIRSILQTK